MIGRETYVANLHLVERTLSNPALEGGCIIECGTWRGGMAGGLVMIGGRERDYYFFDSFKGLPPTSPRDGDDARRWQADTTSPFYFENCAATREELTSALSRAQLPRDRLHVHEGFFADTFPMIITPPIAVLRLDADWYDSTILCFEKFWDQLLPGALVVIDDYYTFEGCRRAVHRFLADRAAPEAIRQSRFGKVAYIVKS
jgi:O-methyltransferase